MAKHSDPLAKVAAELERRKGELPEVAKSAGLTYDTVLRIKNGENDPGYSKVMALHRALFGPKPTAMKAEPARVGD